MKLDNNYFILLVRHYLGVSRALNNYSKIAVINQMEALKTATAEGATSFSPSATLPATTPLPLPPPIPAPIPPTPTPTPSPVRST